MVFPLKIERVPVDDAVRLLSISRQTFFDAFAYRNNASDMELFAARAFILPSFQEQLRNPQSLFFYAFKDDEIAGYLKLNYGQAQTELQDEPALEVERIYVLQKFQGQKIGAQLLDFAIDTAMKQHLSYVWLGVWEHNHDAIRFYESKGFIPFGSHPFMLGNDKQTDLLMKKVL